MEFQLNNHINFLLENYLNIFPDEKNKLRILKEQLENNEKMGNRKNFNGHIVADAYILSNDQKQFILIHNINLDIWLAPGGHWEEKDKQIYNTAKREALEETSLKNIKLHQWHIKNDYIPFSINTHLIPKNINKNEEKHYHHGFRYIFILEEYIYNIEMQTEEIKGFKWLPINEDVENFLWNCELQKIRNIIL